MGQGEKQWRCCQDFLAAITLIIQDYHFAISILSKQCMHRSFYQETWPEQMFDGEEWFKLSTPPSFGFGDLINDDDQPNIGCFIIDQASRPGRRIMVIQLTAEIEHFTRSCIIIRTERVEIWRRQLTQFNMVPGYILTQFFTNCEARDQAPSPQE